MPDVPLENKRFSSTDRFGPALHLIPSDGNFILPHFSELNSLSSAKNWRLLRGVNSTVIWHFSPILPFNKGTLEMLTDPLK